jgi:hypothetical protein
MYSIIMFMLMGIEDRLQWSTPSKVRSFNPLDGVTPLGVKSYSVRNAMINIKDIF